MVKFKEYYERMYTAHKEQFDAFEIIHNGYQMDRPAWADQFHGEGMKLMEVIKDWERRLCLQMEKGKNSSYSAKLAEKFMEEVKKHYPLVMRIGVRSSLDQPAKPAASQPAAAPVPTRPLVRSLD